MDFLLEDETDFKSIKMKLFGWKQFFKMEIWYSIFDEFLFIFYV